MLEGPEPESALAVEEPKPAPVQARTVDRPATTATKHIAKDYSYVRAEVRRIAIVAGSLIVCLIVIALLRN